jgi:hypothetical protein
MEEEYCLLIQCFYRRKPKLTLLILSKLSQLFFPGNYALLDHSSIVFFISGITCHDIVSSVGLGPSPVIFDGALSGPIEKNK